MSFIYHSPLQNDMAIRTQCMGNGIQSHITYGCLHCTVTTRYCRRTECMFKHDTFPYQKYLTFAGQAHCRSGSVCQPAGRLQPESGRPKYTQRAHTHAFNARRKYRRRKLKQNGSLDLNSLLFLLFLTIYSPTCVYNAHTLVHRPKKDEKRRPTTRRLIERM